MQGLHTNQSDKEMSKKRNIWDIIFSQDSSEFPIQRSYLQEPRGSLNPINSQVDSEVSQEMVEEIKKTITDPNDLYALDFELNFVIRKLDDFTLFADIGDIEGWLDGAGCPVPGDMISTLESFLNKWGEDKFICIHDLMFELLNLGYDRKRLRKGEYDRKEYPNLVEVSNFQNAVQLVIENSKLDWKHKAEAFLRASFIRGYNTADDETIIYLVAQQIEDKELINEAQHRWERYKKEWDEMFFDDKNPYKCKFSPDRLRFIHWDKLSCLRPLEPQLTNKERNTYTYKLEAQHLLSKDFLSNFARVFSLLRTDIDIDPVKKQLPKLIRKLFYFLAGTYSFEYNYTVSDLYYLSNILFTFFMYRFQHDILNDKDYHLYAYHIRDEIELNLPYATSRFISSIPMITLLALEVHSIFNSGVSGIFPFMQKAREWLLRHQSSYGYWYDGVNNPEYTTVLVLDALTLIDGKGTLSFPLKTKLSNESLPQPIRESTVTNIPLRPVLIIDFISKSLRYADQLYRPKFKGGRSKVWDFVNALVMSKMEKIPLPRISSLPNLGVEFDWKNQYDTLSRKLGGYDVLKQFIISNGDSYELTDNVIVTVNTSARAITSSKAVEYYGTSEDRELDED